MKQIEIQEYEMLKDYKDVLSIKDLKEILGTGKNQTYKLINSGIIPHFRIGKKIKVSKLDLIKFLQNGKQ